MKITNSYKQRFLHMNLNKKLIIVLFAVIFASCSTNNNIQVIDSENIKIEELEKNFNRVIGNGVLQGKGKSNFSSPFIFESSGNNSIIVFKDFFVVSKWRESGFQTTSMKVTLEFALAMSFQKLPFLVQINLKKLMLQKGYPIGDYSKLQSKN